MIKVYKNAVWLIEGKTLVSDEEVKRGALSQYFGDSIPKRGEAGKGTIAQRILQEHNVSADPEKLRIRFDALTSHDITYVGIIQTARASGLEEFPMPYVLTNCHNSLCAVGGTINGDDHMFGLSAAKKYGGIFVPPHMAVLHQYMREMYAGCGKMILGSDSHTRYGALGTMAVGEGGPELVKQLLGRTWDCDMPETVAVYLRGRPVPGVGPHDIALAVIGAVFPGGLVKNRIMEFVGPGVSELSVDERIGIDVMTTETACLSSIWRTDEKVRDYLALHGRGGEYEQLEPDPVSCYAAAVEVDLSAIRPMIALPFHPSNTYEISELTENAHDILRKVELDARERFGGRAELKLTDKIINGRLNVQQGIIAGCAGGGFENICAAADILAGSSIGGDVFRLSVYPSSQPVNIELTRNGVMTGLMQSGAVIRTAFCGPCFGAGDTPANGELSIRHSTRNFPNREGSKPGEGQLSAVALMDARSIAATARNAGALTAATELDVEYRPREYAFDRTVYDNRCWFGFGTARPDTELKMGPNISDWPEMRPLPENLLLYAASVISDAVTTTDELIPSGETSSLRSNPLRLAEFTLSRRDPGYAGRAKRIQELERERTTGDLERCGELSACLESVKGVAGGELSLANTGAGSFVYARRPGDGSAREQAASCQRVLGGLANIAQEYATKRYRSNLINWGMLPFTYDGEARFEVGDWIFVPQIRRHIIEKSGSIEAYVIRAGEAVPVSLRLQELTGEEREIILDGCLINHYRRG